MPPINLFAPKDGGQQPANSLNLIEIKAGKSTLNGSTVVSDPRKGIFYLTKNPDDQLLHWCWKPRGPQLAGAPVEDDFILFPGDAEFKVASGTTFVLKFLTSSNRVFYWMQQTVTPEQLAKIQKILKDGGAAPEQSQQGLVPEEQQQLLRMLQSEGVIDSEMAASLMQEAEEEDLVSIELLQPIVRDAALRTRLFPHYSGGGDLNLYMAGEGFQQDMEHIRSQAQSSEFLQSIGIQSSDLDDSVEDAAVAVLTALNRKLTDSAMEQ